MELVMCMKKLVRDNTNTLLDNENIKTMSNYYNKFYKSFFLLQLKAKKKIFTILCLTNELIIQCFVIVMVRQ